MSTENKRSKKKEIDFKYNMKLYLSFMKKHKLLIACLIFIIFISELTYTIDKYIFKNLIDKGTAFSAGSLALQAFYSLLLILIIAYFASLFVRTISKWLYLHLINKLESGTIQDLKLRFFNHIIHLSHEFHTTHRTGSLISRLVRGGSAMERMTDFFVFNIVPLIMQFGITLVAVAQFDKTSALALIIISILFILYSLIINKIQTKSNVEANNAEDYEKATISDIFTNIDSIKYFGKESTIKKRFERITDSTKKLVVKNWNYYRWMDSGQGLISAIGLFALIYFPMKGFIAGDITIGALVFIYTIYGALLGHLYGLMNGIRNFYIAMADFESLFQYSKIENEVKDHENSETLKIKHGNIEFKDVSFSYKKRKIFTNLNLKIGANTKVALVGPSGSGKSTFVKLLYRMYEVNKGEILVDGKNIKDFKQESLRSELSIVPQECILFDDTVYNNILFSRPNASRSEVLKAIKFAQLDKVIAKFSNKESTIVGERGVKLSGGEKQRVSIARAILANKKVLVLDEATSSLDSETEHEIQADLETLMQGRTSIIIAHRLSTIMKADVIVVLDEGKVVQMGNHYQLINKPGLYKKLWHLQKGGYIK